MNPQSMMNMERPYLRARRRVRQRVDAGEPRNSYSSIPGFSFRSMSSSNVSTTPPITATPPHHPFLAAAAAARLNGFNGPGSNGIGPPPGAPPGAFGPPPPPHLMGGHSPFFRPPFPPGEFHGSPHMMGGPHHHFMGHPRPPFGPRPFMLMHQHGHLNHPHLPPGGSSGQMSNGLGAPTAPPPAVSSTNCGNNGFLQNFHQSVVGDLRAGMAAAACAAAAAVQRAQILMQQQSKKDLIEGNGESAVKEPLKEKEPIDEGESGDGAELKKDLKPKEDDLSGNGESSKAAALSVDDDNDDVEGEAGDCGVSSGEGDGAAADERQNQTTEGSNEEPSLVESLSKETECSQKQCSTNEASPFLKELIRGKLTLAAAAAVASRHQQSSQQEHNVIMEQTLAAARDFARHANNNDLKDNKAANEANAAVATNFMMSQLFKMRQEALNMSLRQQQQSEMADKVETDEEEKDDDLIEEEEEEELPIDLQRTTSEDGNSVHSQASPRSPSSDAGLSTSSAGGKADKASRLEHIVSSMQRASPSLPKEGGKDLNNAGTVNGCKKRKLYQPVQTKSGTSGDESEVHQEKKVKEDNDENQDPKIPNGDASSSPGPLNNAGNNNLPPSSMVQMHYMEMARRFLQDQQDKAAKEAVTREILADTIGKNNDIAEKLITISPELRGLADLLKSEITSSLAIIIDSIVGRFLQANRNNNPAANTQQSRPPLVGMKPSFLSPASGVDQDLMPPMPSLKTNSTPSGRAPQVRDRAAPRTSVHGPVSMYNPNTPKITPPVTTTPTSLAFPLPPTLRPAPGLLQPLQMPPTSNTPGSTGVNNNNSEDENVSSPSPVGRDLSPPEQDEALSLVVTPKKRRHKVTDTRITPRTLSRVLGEPLAELHKQFPHFAAGLKNSSQISEAGNNQRLPGSHPLFPGLPAPPGLLAGLPTSVAIPNPSLGDFNPFSSFYSPPHLPNASSAGATPPSGLPNLAAAAAAAAAAQKPKMMMSSTPPLEKSRPRERHHSSSDLGREVEGSTPPSLLRHPSLLSRGSPDFAARLREDRNRDEEDFERMGPMSFMSGFSGLGGEATSSTLTPMHLRKAKLMFFWVRYPSSAILKMYFPDIKFNKNNTAQLVKWFSNFREFFYIQMEKYARQALSEGVKSDSELHVSEDSELYRVINVHYNRNNHIEVPSRFRWVVEQTLREFFKSVQLGKDMDPSWKKQIYKVIARLDDYVPDYFKSQSFLDQLE